jgi:hypothetical protein
MATAQIYGPTILTADDAASSQSIVMRGASGGIVGATIEGSTIKTTGGTVTNVSTKTTTYTATATDSVLLVDSTSGNITINLPAAALSTGQLLTVKKTVAANTVTLDGSGSETIDGATTLAMTAQWASRTIVCNGTAWFVLGSV